LGRAIVHAALAAGHQVTLFNRGQSNPGLFADLETLHGDRDGDLGALQGRRFDAVIDTCGYVPRVVRQSAQLLADAADRYLFVSTLSVYADPQPAGTAEDAPLAVLAEETEEITGETYGPLKAACERVVRQFFPERAFLVRPGLIVGPHDRSDRFTYWPVRVARGGEVLAPGRPDRLVQFIDVRDLAAWMVEQAAGGTPGAYNAVGHPIPMRHVLETCRTVGGGDARFTWVDDSFLVEHEVGAWMELPLWIPESDPMAVGFFSFDNGKAVTAGLAFRPLQETVRATLEWANTRPPDHAWRTGLTAERERELLQEWHRDAR